MLAEKPPVMRVGLGVSVLARGLATGGVDGIGTYTRELLRHLGALPDIGVVPVSWGEPRAPVSADGTCVMQHSFMPAATLAVLTGLPFAGSRDLARRVDLLHAPDHLIPKLAGVPVVATIHDAIPLAHPEWLRSRAGRIKSVLWQRSARWTQHVITGSEFSKVEIQRYFDVPAERITVIAHGVDPAWFQSWDAVALAAVRARLGLPARYFLAVGTLQPRKNIERAIEAWRSLPAGVREASALVIVGRPGWKCDELVEALSAQRYGPGVRWLERIQDADLRAVVKGATGLVANSLYEGFGLPVLEAFAAGTPVIASSTTSLVEVAADAALLVDPLDVPQTAAAMEQLAGDVALQETLRRRGTERAAGFSWARTAAETAAVYRQVLQRA